MTTLIETSTMLRSNPRHETGCDPVSCPWTVAKVRVYLIVWRQAAIAREPFEDVLGSSCRSSRADRGRQPDRFSALDIRIALEQARDTGLELAEWNTERVARWLCTGEHREPNVDASGFEALR